MTDEFKKARDAAAKEFATLAVSVNCQYDSDEISSRYGFGVSFGFKEGMDRGYAYAQEEAEPLISEIHKRDLEYLANKLAAERAKNAELVKALNFIAHGKPIWNNGTQSFDQLKPCKIAERALSPHATPAKENK